MSPQLLLFHEPEARPPTDGLAHRPAWVLDEETRAIGRRRVAEARSILRARRLTTGPPGQRPADAQPAA